MLSTKTYYCTCNNKYKRLNKKLYNAYLRRIQSSLKSNPKRFWSYIDEQRKESGLPSTMNLGDKQASTLPDICELFRQHLSAVFVNEDLNPHQVLDAASKVPHRSDIGQHPHITDLSIISACARLKCSTNPGPDGIPAIILKRCCTSLAPPLVTIFNNSILSGRFPSFWKKSFVFPVHKKGKKDDVTNYRGIASLCATSKLFELIVLDFLKHNCVDYVSQTQHGFIEKRSTSTNLIAYTSFVIKSMEAHKQVDAIYTDFSAAFDKINHQIMVSKLNRLGISGALLDWLHSYLVDRSMSVKIRDTTSVTFDVTSGVPQGSHIGPFLFLLYLNDVNILLKCFKLSYADDFKLFYEITCHQDAVVLQNELDNFSVWCSSNRMCLNPSKCSVISFGRKHSLIHFDYAIAGKPISRVSSIKDLGVVLDTKLNFKEHVGYITSKASKCLGFIFRAAKHFTDIHCLKALYCSLVRSTLEYAVVVWAPYYRNSVEQIEAIQHKFIRFALRHLPWSDPFNLPRYEDRCLLIDLPLLENRRNVTKACFVADVLQSRVDCTTVLNSLNIDIHRRNLRSYQFLRLPASRTNYGYNEPIANMSRLFNRCYHVFDFNLSRPTIKRLFSEVFRTQ